ncbi:MAG: 3-isopropylmalate dehydrogenase [Lachnospiraceae bacterium]|nr:3-isopropylmalate dehydrogenase [Lachnospiraceae bacterium]
MEEQKTKENAAKGKLLQWHPAFYASLQIELSEEADKLIFETEHNLGTKPMLIDLLVIKKHSETRIQKNIGRIFRKYNIIEYKSPEDYLSIDDFYKVYGYSCFYKSMAEKQNDRKADEITITFVCRNYPRKFLKHLKSERCMKIHKNDEGIYYLVGDIFPMQLIITSKLSKEHNLWLKHLSNDLKENDVDKLIKEYKKHEKENLYESVMDIIIRANNEAFKGVTSMCDALMELYKDIYKELYKDELTQCRKEALQEGLEQGLNQGLRVFVRNMLQRGMSDADIMALAECSRELLEEEKERCSLAETIK